MRWTVTEKLLPAKAVIDMFGVSHMTLWRWMKDEGVAFPKPKLVINRRRYWDAADIDAYSKRGQVQNAVKAAPPKIKDAAKIATA